MSCVYLNIFLSKKEKMAEETTDVFNSTFEVDKETSILDRKFEIDDTPNKRRSTRDVYTLSLPFSNKQDLLM